jgi:hypothetical protein
MSTHRNRANFVSEANRVVSGAPAPSRRETATSDALRRGKRHSSGDAPEPPRTKAGKVRLLLHLTNAEIERRLGVSQPYIRAVRQRTGPDGKPRKDTADTRYQRRRYREDETFRERAKARVRTFRQKRRLMDAAP